MSDLATTVILAGLVLDGSGGPGQRDRSVTISGDRITAVGPIDRAAAAAIPDTTVVDLRTGTLTPGLIDAHAHVAWGLDDQRGWVAARSSPEAIFGWAVDAARRGLAAGITTIRDCGAPGTMTVRLRDAIAADLICGPRIVAAGPCITTTGGHGDFIGVCADGGDELRLRVRELCDAGVDFIKVMASGGSMDPHTDRRAAQYSTSDLAILVDEAHRSSRRVVAHCNATESIRRAVAAGADTIAHCNWLGRAEGSIDYDPVVATQMVANGTFIDLNLAATMRSLRDGDGDAQHWPDGTEPANRWELHREIREQGGRLLFSSDAFGPAVASFPSLLGQAIVRLNIDAAEAVHRSTAVPAEALGLADQVGMVAVGSRADLAAFDGDLETDPSTFERPRAVWRSGRLVAENGRIGDPHRG